MAELRIIPRGEWGARYADGGGYAPLPATECWLHHSVTTPPDTTAPYDDDIAAIRTLEQIGQDRFSQGMSYTWLITPAGLIFEGHSVGRLGAHTAGRNSRARAICLVGNYELAEPTQAQILAAAWLLQQGRGRGWLTSARLNGGHRDVSSTACPGRYAYARIGDINALAAGPPITHLEDNMPLTKEDLTAIASVVATAVWGTQFPGGHAQAHLTVTNSNTWEIKAQLAALDGALDERDAALLAAIRADGDETDVRQLAAALAPLLPAGLDPHELATAIADEQDRRARDSDPTTGPAS